MFGWSFIFMVHHFLFGYFKFFEALKFVFPMNTINSHKKI